MVGAAVKSARPQASALAFVILAMLAAGSGCGRPSTLSERSAVPRASNSFVIVERSAPSQVRIGPYRPGHSHHFAKAVQVFGKPSSWGLDGNLCVVRWRRLGLDLEFRTTGVCEPPRLKGLAGWCGVSAYTPRWRSEGGLRVGDAVARLHRLYPRAELDDSPPRPPTWRLSPERGLSADVWGGRVVALHLVGYCI